MVRLCVWGKVVCGCEKRMASSIELRIMHCEVGVRGLTMCVLVCACVCVCVYV